MNRWLNRSCWKRAIRHPHLLRVEQHQEKKFRRISKDDAQARKEVEAAFEKSTKLYHIITGVDRTASKIEVSERDIERRRRALLEQRKRL